MLMPRKQVLVQLDDDLVARLDAPAEHLEVSRSELLRRAALTFLDAARLELAERVAVEAHRRQPQNPDWVATAHRLAGETAPER